MKFKKVMELKLMDPFTGLFPFESIGSQGYELKEMIIDTRYLEDDQTVWICNSPYDPSEKVYARFTEPIGVLDKESREYLKNAATGQAFYELILHNAVEIDDQFILVDVIDRSIGFYILDENDLESALYSFTDNLKDLVLAIDSKDDEDGVIYRASEELGLKTLQHKKYLPIFR